MANKDRFTEKQIEDAIKGSAGIKVVIAERLKCTRQTLENYIEKYPGLAESIQMEREARLDLAELVILTNIQMQRQLQQASQNPVDTSDAWKLLDKIGTRRGYGDKQQVTVGVGSPATELDEDEIVLRIMALMKKNKKSPEGK